MKKLLSIAFLFACINPLFSAHIIGGEIYYDYLGNDEYKVTIELYRDCNGAGAAFDNPLGYTVFNADNSMFAQYFVPLLSSEQLPVVYDDPCVTPPSDICVQRGLYIDTITLPATANGYYISYQRCCWTAAITNILNPGDYGLTLTTSVPGSNLVAIENNAARFNAYPQIVLCSGNTLDFDHSATDPDGDSLVYSLCTPPTVDLIGGGPVYDPEYPAPYANLTWEAGFSGTQPFGPGSNTTIDASSGAMTYTPSLTGMFVAAVCVEEWRDGVLINTKSRTFGYRVVTCEQILPMQVDVFGNASLIEDCGSAGFIVIRDDTTDAVVIQLLVSGTTANGVDHNFLPDTLLLEAGVFTDTISVFPFLDNLVEGDETLEFSIIVENICEGTYDTTTAVITIQDYIPMQVQVPDSLNLCDETMSYAALPALVTNGVPPYYYAWSPLAYANNDTLTFPTSDLQSGLNIFTVGVADACDKVVVSPEIQIWNQCKLAPPNIITSNGDGVNDLFVIKNREDYDRVHVTIVNRWGNLIYENEDYQDDWNGSDKSGAPLVEGVYYYTATPKSDKYVYDDVEETQFTAHGFLYIVK
jgi:gliding motility-associated-like protein